MAETVVILLTHMHCDQVTLRYLYMDSRNLELHIIAVSPYQLCAQMCICRPVDCISNEPEPNYLPGTVSKKIFSNQPETGRGVSTYPNRVEKPGASLVYAVDQELQTQRLDHNLTYQNGSCFTFPSGVLNSVSVQLPPMSKAFSRNMLLTFLAGDQSTVGVCSTQAPESHVLVILYLQPCKVAGFCCYPLSCVPPGSLVFLKPSRVQPLPPILDPKSPNVAAHIWRSLSLLCTPKCACHDTPMPWHCFMKVHVPTQVGMKLFCSKCDAKGYMPFALSNSSGVELMIETVVPQTPSGFVGKG